MNAVTPMAQQNVIPTTTAEMLFNDAAFARLERIAAIMASGKVTIPKHLQGNQGDCFAVLLQATRWQLDPYAIAQKTFSVGGTLGYEAQLVAAVINSSPAVMDRFHFEWFGEWSQVIGKTDTRKGDKGEYHVPAWKRADEEGLGVKVWATLRHEDEPRELTVLLVQAGTRFSTLWADDPKQQLAYLAQKRWARLYCPDVIMGVYTPDELEQRPEREVVGEVIEKTPSSQTSAIKERLKHRAQSESKPSTEPDWKAIAAKLTASIASATTPAEMKSLKAEATKLPEPWQTPVREAYNARSKELAAKANPTFDKSTGEILNQEPPEHADWIAAIDECQTPDQLDALALQMPEEVRSALADEIASRESEFSKNG